MADSRHGSLRAAIGLANGPPEASTITFTVSGRIELASAGDDVI